MPATFVAPAVTLATFPLISVDGKQKTADRLPET